MDFEVYISGRAKCKICGKKEMNDYWCAKYTIKRVIIHYFADQLKRIT